jgi:hypothetical protein
LFKPDSLRRAIAYAEAERADHVVLFPHIIMRRPGEYMMIAFFQTMFMFGHRPWKVADPKTKDHMGVGAFNLIRRRAYDSIGTYKTLRMEVVDDMKLGKVVKNAGFAQRNVFGADLISIRWANGAMGVVNNLTKNFFAVLSFQWPRTILSAVGLAFLNLLPFVGICRAHGWGALALCNRAEFDVHDLYRHVAAFGSTGVLFFAAPSQRHALYLYLVTLHGPRFLERRHHLARDKISAGGIEEGNGVKALRPGNLPAEGTEFGQSSEV